MGGSATRDRHHLGIPFDFIQPALKTCRPIRRSSAAGRTQIQGAHMPRTSPFQTVQARGLRPRNRGAGSNNFPPPPGPVKSQSLRKVAEASLLSRWSAILTHAAQHVFAASLLDLDCAGTSTTEERRKKNGDAPSISASFCQKCPSAHRLPAVSQPASKQLRLGFRPAIHAHPETPV